ncbi:MAG TPA: P-loop NTPase [Candidatus Binataceae bacterium]|nr:P-loop NTPase [Candidatus Binataceae bacterium]
MRLFGESENSIQPHGETHGVGDASALRVRPSNVKAIVALASARGGTGKSSLAINLAAALALKGRKIGILDADLNSPSIAAMLGMRRIQAFQAAGVIEPAAGPLGLRVIGTDLLSGGASSPMAMFESEIEAPPPAEPATPSDSQMLARLLSETRFGALDLLLIDVPSGLDQFKRIAALAELTGVLFATQSSDLALRAMRAAIDAAAEASTPVLGVVENMTGFFCAHCQSVRPLFPQGDTMGLRREFEASLLGRLPFDPRLAESCDRGIPFIRQYSDAPLAKELIVLAERLEQVLAARTNSVRAASPA